MKIVLVGAGSMQFGYDSLGDIFCSKTLGGCGIVLHDINATALDAVYKYAKDFIAAHKLDFSLSATTDRKVAFRDADYIIISIEVGDRFKLWEEDWKIPQQYGVHQVYGENGGPGGIFHALRIIPPILEIVGDAMELCPEAWIFNFSNPMTAICTTVKRAYPEAKFVGMCHEIGWLFHWLPRMLGRTLGELEFRAAGLNHFSCMLELRDRNSGKDLYPEVLEKAHGFFRHEQGYSDIWEKYLETGDMARTEQFHKESADLPGRHEWADRKLLRFILENYKLLPITVDSHFGEYVGWAWDVVDHRGILDFYDFYKTSLGQRTPAIELKMHERVIPIIDGMREDAGFEEPAVNILNDGLIPDLPAWIAVEVPARIDRQGVTGIPLGEVPKGYLALLRTYAGVYDLTAEAVLRKSRELVVQAVLACPVVHRVATVNELVDRMLRQQARWLGYLQ